MFVMCFRVFSEVKAAQLAIFSIGMGASVGSRG